MRYPNLLCVIAISVWPVVACGQTSAANDLPGPLRVHLNEDRFQLVSSLRGLPLGVREELPALFGGSSLDIAEPGAAFRATDVISDPNQSTRRLVMGACSSDHCLVYYERGGVAHTWHVALFHWTPAATRFEWGGLAPGGLKTIDELRKAALSGAVKASGSW